MKTSILVALSIALAPASALAASDPAFLMDAMKGDNSEVALGAMAQKQDASAKTRTFADMMVRDHGAHKLKLATLARTLHVEATDDLTPDGMKARDMLAKLRGAPFDAAFKQHMVADHQKAIAKYLDAAQHGKNAAVRKLAAQTLPTLRKHLAAAQGL